MPQRRRRPSTPRDPSSVASGSKLRRKALQLCRQVAETIDGALADSEDDLVRDLQVVSVVPAPDSSRLLVTVRPVASLPGFDPALTLAHLDRASRMLREEVAAAINRRKCPTLVFGFSSE